MRAAFWYRFFCKPAMLVLFVGATQAQVEISDIDPIGPPYSYLDDRETYNSAREPLYLFLSRVEQARNVDERGATHESFAAQLMVKQFIAGVVDAGEDIYWCIRRSNIPPHEIDEEIIAMLFKVQAHDEELRVRGTAKIIAKYLEKKYRCDRDKIRAVPEGL